MVGFPKDPRKKNRTKVSESGRSRPGSMMGCLNSLSNVCMRCHDGRIYGSGSRRKEKKIRKVQRGSG